MTASENDGGSGVDEAAEMSSGSAPGSPRNRLKFLCSHGGKILPRPTDGHLKYVSGETRVVSVPHDINFSELTKKLASLFDGNMVLKYQLIPEDLEALVSVKSDEDLQHMLDEYDRHETGKTPRLRAFLFPICPTVTDNNPYSVNPFATEHRYVDSINGFNPTSRTRTRPTSINTNFPSCYISSTCSSPKSPESCTVDCLGHETILLSNSQHGSINMHKVESSPSICGLNPQTNSTHHVHHHYYRQNPHHRHPPINTPPEPNRVSVPERLVSVKSVGRDDSWKYQVGHSPIRGYSPTPPSRGSGCCIKCVYSDEYHAHMGRRLDLGESFSRSPSLPRSPQ